MKPQIEMTAVLQRNGVERTFNISGPVAFRELAGRLMLAGHSVREDITVPGLFRIDGGPELTLNQFLQVGSEILAQPLHTHTR